MKGRRFEEEGALLQIETANMILYCRRWQETVDFYRHGLKLEITAARDWFIEFRLNDHACLSIADMARTSMQGRPVQGVTIAMKVADIASTHQRLEEAGLHPQAIRDHSWGAKVFYLYDPDGNRLEFWSPNRKA
jgi:catechol 2,3-dioxygenase-like lactoylglutathione lyase family enzyme